MDKIHILSKHLLNPFSYEHNNIKIQLSDHEKHIAWIGGVAGLIFAGIGAPSPFIV